MPPRSPFSVVYLDAEARRRREHQGNLSELGQGALSMSIVRIVIARDDQRGNNLQSVERMMIEKALLQARFNKSKAAKELGLSRHQLYIRMRRHGWPTDGSQDLLSGWQLALAGSLRTERVTRTREHLTADVYYP